MDNMKKLLIILFLTLGINSAKSQTLDSAKINIIKTLAKADTNMYKMVIVDTKVYVLNRQTDIVNESFLPTQEINIGYMWLILLIIIILFIISI